MPAEMGHAWLPCAKHVLPLARGDGGHTDAVEPVSSKPGPLQIEGSGTRARHSNPSQ